LSRLNQSDRRKALRYALKTDLFLVFRPDFDRLGALKDVSLGGAAFEYPVFGHYEKVDEVEVDIFASGLDHFMVHNVPCRVVYDIKMERSSLSGIETRRCGLKFEHLSPHHRQLIEQLLGNYGTRPLPDECKSNLS
jgi:hypothetical protein